MELPSIFTQLTNLYDSKKIERYKKDFKDFNPNRYLVYPFVSPIPRSPILEPFETSNTILDNNEFPLLFYIPESAYNKPIENLIIVVNGFNEGGSLVRLYSDQNWGLAHLFGKPNRNASVVLIPIPFHYWRKPIGNEYYSHSLPSYLVYDNPIRFYLAYRQLMFEIDAIHTIISNQNERFSQFFSPNIAIHLFGFSLGGLAVLAALLRDQLNNTSKFSSCTLLNSGGVLDTFSFALTGYSDAQVTEIKDYYYSMNLEDIVAIELSENLRNDDERIYRIFENRVIGPRAMKNWRTLEKLSFKNGLRAIKKKLCFIFGDDDEILDTKKVLSTFPINIPKIKQKFIPNLRHLPSRSLAWKNEGQSEEAVDFSWQHMMQNIDAEKE